MAAVAAVVFNVRKVVIVVAVVLNTHAAAPAPILLPVGVSDYSFIFTKSLSYA